MGYPRYSGIVHVYFFFHQFQYIHVVIENIYVLVIFIATGTFLRIISFLFLHVYSQHPLLKQQQLLQQTEIKYQHELMSVIFESQEKERMRIGRDLHDSIGVALSSLRMIIEGLDEAIAQGNLRSFKVTCKTVIDKIIVDTRNIAHNLSPGILSLYGFFEAVAELTDMVEKSGKMSVTLDNEAEDILSQLPFKTALSLYRVLEELFNNTIRHAHATEVRICFRQEDDKLFISYEDDGRGLGGDAGKGTGLLNIQNRLKVLSASYEMQAAREKGFSIQIKIPV
jgi:two-component system NarL family sensor kinase